MMRSLTIAIAACLVVVDSLVNVPGAGMDPSSLKPFDSSYKDGFSFVDCVQDAMLAKGDKHGDGKYSYDLEDVSRVSIIHYSDMVARTEQKPMTHELCYSFCRSLQNMGFFAINNGRDCYCTPFFMRQAGDSSDCDAPCDGDKTQMCGGKSKSSMFEMHACNNAKANLENATSGSQEVSLSLMDFVANVSRASSTMQTHAESLQTAFGKIGDAAATGHLQNAKAFAGELEHAAEVGYNLLEQIKKLPTSEGATAEATEKVVADLRSTTAEAAEEANKLGALYKEAVAPDGKGHAKLYYPVMYFVEKDFQDLPSTCGGNAAAKPMIASFDGCASACESAGPTHCVGFSHFSDGEGLCFLLSSATSATYYTGCNRPAFLQKRSADMDAKCVLRFSSFEGTSIKPDPSGKCAGCLKEANKADRCFV